MNLFFDVDYTILGMDGSLRPCTWEVFRQLTRDGHAIYVWSGMGVRTVDIKHHKLDIFVSGLFEKPLEDYEPGMEALGIPVRPDLVIDDYPEIVTALGGVLVRPYFFVNPEDREMERVYCIIADYALNGSSDDPAFSPGRNGQRGPLLP